MINSAIIDLNIIENNAKTIREKLPDNTKFCAVVKDDAYGHGIVQVASKIYNTVDMFAVKNIEEAKKLRYGGIDKDILILIPVNEKEIYDALRFNFTLTIASFCDAKALLNVVKKSGQKVKVHIKFNTGMNRQGIDSIEELKYVIEFLLKNSCIFIEGLFSHFACPEKRKKRKKQVDKFLLANFPTASYPP